MKLAKWILRAAPALVAGWLAVGSPSRTSAQEAPRAVLLRPELRGDDVDGVGHAIERVLRTRLAEHAVVRLAPTPDLTLPDLQLAVGCVAESAVCLDQVLTQLEVDMLLRLGVERAGEELMVTLTRFSRGDAQLASTSRRVGGTSPDSAALDEVDSLVRQAFGLGPAPVEREVVVEEDRAVDETPPPASGAPRDGTELVAPLVLLGVGAAALAVGIGLGVVSQDSASAYASLSVDTAADAEAATSLRERAEREALAANILMPVGGAVMAAGVVVWILQETLRGDGAEHAAGWGLDLGPNTASLTYRGRFDGSVR